MGVDLSAILEEDTAADQGDKIHAHIVDRGENPMSADALILEARVNGLALTALCGYTWVPSRNPERYPVCPKCLEIFEFAKDFRGV